jgi:transcription elongation GreA/GreB family factor
LTTATDSFVEELLALARKAAPQPLEDKFLEAFASAPERLDAYLRIGEELRSSGRRERAGQLLSITIEHYEKNGTAEDRVRLLSFVAGSLEKDRNHRQLLVRALQDLHGQRQGFELFLDASGLRQDAPVEQALRRLEKMFDYDVGRYVLHASGWGVGFVEGVDAIAREILIVFEGSRRHSMPVQSAVDTMTPLPADDWRVLKHFKTDELRKLCESDPGEVVARILQQIGRPADVATMKGFLEGTVIPAEQWSRWWTGARKAALARPDVELQGNRIVWRKIDAADRLGAMRKVMTAKQTLILAGEFLRSIAERGTPDPKVMADLFPVLYEGAAKHAAPDDPSPLELLLIADEIGETHHLNRVPLEERLKSAMNDEATFFRRLSELGNPKLEKRALDRFHLFTGDAYAEKLLKLARVASSRLLETVVADLLDAGRIADLKGLLYESIRKPEALPEFLVFARRRQSSSRFAPLLAEAEPKSLVERCLRMGEQHGKMVNPRLRALSRQVAKELTDSNCKEFRALVKSLTLENARLLMRSIDMLRGHTDHAKLQMMQLFGEVHPELAKKEEAAAPHLDETVVYCTADGIKKRNEEYERLINVDLPRVFEAVGKAASFGDLSENAEYTAALEERARMTKKAEEMVEELRRARPIDASLLKEGEVTIGSRVTVRDVANSKTRTFDFLGPWDADLDHGRLDYRAPLAKAFMGHGVGATVRAELGGRPSQFEILDVQPAI